MKFDFINCKNCTDDCHCKGKDMTPICLSFKPAKITNADLIRAMSDEELAKVIKHTCDIEDHIPIEWCANRVCGYQCSLDWLKQKVE